MAGSAPFVGRPAPKARSNSVTFAPAEYDTAGVDPEMKKTLGDMRGALGAGPSADRPGPFDKVVNYVQSIFKGAGKKNVKQVEKR